MTKYYKVVKDTFMWEEGAILEEKKDTGSTGGYEAIEDIWDTTELNKEYISRNIIENQPVWFERVYPDKLDKMLFLTKEQLKEKMSIKFKK